MGLYESETTMCPRCGAAVSLGQSGDATCSECGWIVQHEDDSDVRGYW